jgi:hypothetical protein
MWLNDSPCRRRPIPVLELVLRRRHLTRTRVMSCVCRRGSRQRTARSSYVYRTHFGLQFSHFHGHGRMNGGGSDGRDLQVRDAKTKMIQSRAAVQ